MVQLILYTWLKTNEVNFFKSSGGTYYDIVPDPESMEKKQKYFHWIKNGIDFMLIFQCWVLNVTKICWMQTDGDFLKSGIDLNAKSPGKLFENRCKAYSAAIFKSVILLMRPMAILNSFYNHYEVKKATDKHYLVQINYFEVTPRMEQVVKSYKYHGAINDCLLYVFILSRFSLLIISLVNFGYDDRVQV